MEQGGKAHALERLKEGGFMVPPFFVCDASFSAEAVLKNIEDHLPDASFFAVRSSAQSEDSEQQSFAGYFYSALGVRRERVPDEIKNVTTSFNGKPGAVIVQAFIPSDLAGVLFTEVDKNTIVINATFGLCQPVVNGEACDEYLCDKSGTVLSKTIQDKTAQFFIGETISTEKSSAASLNSSQIHQLAALAAQIQDFFGTPQDIEWCYKDGTLYVLQSRPITRDFSLGKKEYFDSANIAESYSGIVLPLTCTFAKMVYEQVYRDLLHMSGVSKKKIQQHAVIFENLLGFFYGRMYYNMNNWYRMAEFVPGYRRNKQNFELMITSNINEDVEKSIEPSLVFRVVYPLIVGAKVAMYGVTAAHFKLGVKKHLHWLRNHDFEHLTYEQCVILFENLNKRLLRRWYITVENDFFVMTYLGILKKMLDEKDLQQALIFPSKATQQVSALASLSSQMSTYTTLWAAIESENVEAFNTKMQQYPEIRAALQHYLHSFGGRFANELKLESIGVDEDTKKLLTVLRAYRGYQPKPFETRVTLTLPLFKNILARVVLKKFKKYASRREEFRLLRSNTFAMARKLFRRMGSILAHEHVIEALDDIFYLHLDEILALPKSTVDLSKKISERKRQYASYTDIVPPSHFSTTNSQPPAVTGSHRLELGTLYARPASPGLIRGKIKIFKDFSMPSQIDFDILVTAHTDPGWTSLIALSKGLIIEHGGVLSHASIVARELGIPAVIGATDAVSILRDNQIVEIDGSSGIIQVIEYAE